MAAQLAAVEDLALSACQEECTKMWVDLFSSASGLASLAVIVFMLGMAAWFHAFFRRKMNEDARKAAERGE